MKGQIQVFSEFLSFAIGVVVVISIIFIFTNILTPALVDEALDIQMKNVLSQVESIGLQVNDLSNTFDEKSVSLYVNLPSSLNDYNYDLFVRDENFCIVLSDPAYQYCKSNVLDFEGFFYSGKRMILTKDSVKLTFYPE